MGSTLCGTLPKRFKDIHPLAVGTWLTAMLLTSQGASTGLAPLKAWVCNTAKGSFAKALEVETTICFLPWVSSPKGSKKAL